MSSAERDKCACCLVEWANMSPALRAQYEACPSMWNGIGGTDKIDPAMRALEPRYAVTTVGGTACCAIHAVQRLGG